MKKTIFLLLLSFTSSFTFAQNAKDILSKASEAYQKAGGITARFTLDSEDKSNKTTYSEDGKAFMKGNMFRFEMVDAVIWFDGKTQYSYVTSTQEVNITNPDAQELASISPLVIFNMYKSGFNLKYKGEKKILTQTVYEVELTPQQKSNDFERITIFVDKMTNIFCKLIITDKEGMTNSITIKNLKTGVNLLDNSFKFDKKDYPNAEIVDLR